jgi:DNA-dependent RNA polymerase auxiliary subunit epsilon
MSHTDKRYKRAIERIGAEAFWLNTYQSAICGLAVDAIGLDFFRVSLNALKDARIIRLIRVLENTERVASIWYLHRTNEKLFREIAKRVNFNIELAAELSDKFLGIRDKTFVHIDKDKVFDPEQLYIEANIKHQDIDDLVRGLWSLMQALHIEVLGEEIKSDNYTGDDIKHLANLRDRAI